MILEIGICALLAGSLVFALVRGLSARGLLALPRRVARPMGGLTTSPADEDRLPIRNQLRRQKAFTVQEAEVWIACAQMVRALDAPKHTPSRR